MNIIVRGRNVRVSDCLEAHCHDRVRRAVQPFADRVVRVELVLIGLRRWPAAPTHGCRAFVTLESGEQLMFTGSDRDHYRAVSRATFGTGRHLARMVDRKRTLTRARFEPLGVA